MGCDRFFSLSYYLIYGIQRHTVLCKTCARIEPSIWNAAKYMTLANKEALKDEKNIVWLEDPNDYPWVRESNTNFSKKQGVSKNRRSEIERGGKKLIGYGELEDDSPSGEHYYRRIFTIRKDDYENYKNDYPTEAVDPLTVEPKTSGISPKKKRR